MTEESLFHSQQKQGMFIYLEMSGPALGPIQPRKLVPEDRSLRIMRPEREAYHSSPCSAKFKNAWIYPSFPPYDFKAWCSIKHGDTFNFTRKTHSHIAYSVSSLKIHQAIVMLFIWLQISL
jgi:hypothetical protein